MTGGGPPSYSEVRKEIEAHLRERLAGRVFWSGDGRGDANTFTLEDVKQACMEWLRASDGRRN